MENGVINKMINKIDTIKLFFKKRRFVAQYKLFFSEEWLEVSVKSVVDYMYKILFVVSNVAWGDDPKNPKISGDNLEPILNKLKTKYPEKVIIIRGDYNKQLMHVQTGLDYIKKEIPEATHCLYIDGDEIYTKQQITTLLGLAKRFKYFNKAIRINYNTYFKTIYYKVWPIKYPTALVLFPILPWVKYRNSRNVNAKIEDIPSLFYEHPGYVRNSEQKMKDKIKAHMETEQINGDWYHDVWVNWTPEHTNFHPTTPEFWEKVIPVKKEELPKVMVDTYENWKSNAH